MKLAVGEMLQPMTEVLPEGGLFAVIRMTGIADYRLVRLASEEVRSCDKRVSDVLRAMPTYWAGNSGDCFVLVHPRPDQPYEFVWVSAP